MHTANMAAPFYSVRTRPRSPARLPAGAAPTPQLRCGADVSLGLSVGWVARAFPSRLRSETIDGRGLSLCM